MWDLLLAPLSAPLDPSKRLFWACLLSSLVLASVAVTIHSGRFDLRAQLRALFDRHYWLNRSTLQDLGLMFLNNAIRLLLLVPTVGGHLALTLATGRFLQANLGDAPSLELPWFAIATIYGLTFFVAEDASRFFLHLAMHRCPLLWRFHRVHHSARILTPLTLFRQHPVEQALYFARGTLVFGVVSGFFIWLFGRHLTTFDILGVDLLGFLFNMAAANLRHSHVWLSFGVLERWFVSPAQHQLHHSRDHGNVNLGSYLAIWDRLLGTSRRAGAKQELAFGLPDPHAASGLLHAAPTFAVPSAPATSDRFRRGLVDGARGVRERLRRSGRNLRGEGGSLRAGRPAHLFSPGAAARRPPAPCRRPRPPLRR